MRLPRARHVYDIKDNRDHRDTDKKSAFELTITPYRALFYALSPQPLKPVVLKAKPMATRGSAQRVHIASAMPDGQQAVKVRVRLPDGRRADWVAPVVVIGPKGATVDVPVAFNDPPGRWTIEATELYTGKMTTTRFGVK